MLIHERFMLSHEISLFRDYQGKIQVQFSERTEIGREEENKGRQLRQGAFAP